MPYVGGSLTSFFDAKQQAATRRACRRLTHRAVDRWHEVTAMNTPVDSGNLRTSWYTTAVKSVEGFMVATHRAEVATDVDYAPHVENGTGLWGPKGSKYPITPKDPDGMLAWRDPATGRWIRAKKVMHPGSPGNHMLAIGAHMVEAEFDHTIAAGPLREWQRTIEANV